MIARLTALPKAVWSLYTSGALPYAKAAAYSSLLSVLPLLTVMTTLLVRANADAVSTKITQFLFRVAPPGTEDLLQYSLIERGQRPTSLPVLAVILIVWGSSGIMMSLMQGCQAAYGKPNNRSLWRNVLMAFWLVLVALGPVLLGSLGLVLGERAETIVLRALGFLPSGQELGGWVRMFSKYARLVIVFATTTVVMALIYHFGPDVKGRRNIWPGAVLAGLLWFGATWFFGWYVRNIAQYNVLYGSIAAAIALCVWMWLLSVIAILGCEYNVQLDRARR